MNKDRQSTTNNSSLPSQTQVVIIGVVIALIGGWLITTLGSVSDLVVIDLFMALGALVLSLITRGCRAIVDVQPE